MKNKIAENYLDRKPIRNENIKWTVDDNDKITLHIENKGFFNRIAQKLFGKPKVSFVHLDSNGSFIWQLFDGQKDLTEIANAVDAHFGEAAHPLYERLAKYCQILESYGFIKTK